MDVFLFDDYKDFLRSSIAENKQRGAQSLLADAAGCQRAFISQVLNSHIHLTMDHAAGIASYLNFSELETDYFVELVAMARAATESMRKLIFRRLKDLRRRRADLTEKFSKASSGDLHTLYYSSWHWMAIHVLTSITQFQTASAISEHLGIPLVKTEEILSGLLKMGILEKSKSGRWSPTAKDIFLSRSSPMTFTNHWNWRLKALENIQAGDQDSLHYTAVVALSRKDAEKIKTMLVEFIETSRKIIAPSPEEKLIALALDFFRV